ncbi:MAG: FHA domain-containing protein [Fimbriiglobus sp.]|jgi:adenylate cyclase|nr:FHA domain-containing protein [Fimbriiglobus sp.]
MADVFGRLVPVGGGDPIPLMQEVMTVGRRESCDICLAFTNVSGIHCEFSLRNGLWTVRDMGSSNGTKVNGVRMLSRTLKPGDEIGIAGHKFIIDYIAPEGAPLDEAEEKAENVFGQSLLERAGLQKKPKK